jgi:hypothetical protein
MHHLRRIGLLLGWLAGAWTLSGVEVGDTREQVLAEKGAPLGRMAAGAREILTYPEGKVQLQDGRVTEIAEALRRPAAPPTPAPAPADSLTNLVTQAARSDLVPKPAAPVRPLRREELVEVAADGAAIAKRLRAAIEPLLAAGNFAALVALRQELFSSREHQASGHSALALFYEIVGSPVDEKDEKGWAARREVLERWAATSGAPIEARVSLARFWISSAWHARGSGYENTVSPEQWEVFGNRLEKAAEQLQRAAAFPQKCPGYYLAMQRLALGQGWPRPRYDRLLAEATASHPRWADFHLAAITYLLPRWHGEDGDWLRYATAAADQLGGDDGDVLYARLGWIMFDSRTYDYFIRESGVSWERLRHGLKVCADRYPDSLWATSLLCYFSAQRAELAEARHYFEVLGPRVYTPVWNSARFLTDRELVFSH